MIFDAKLQRVPTPHQKINEKTAFLPKTISETGFGKMSFLSFVILG